MDDLSDMNLDKFKLWSIHALKVFLSKRKADVDGSFDELCARYENFQNGQDQYKKNLHMQKTSKRDISNPVGFFSLHIYMSYSPCGECADRLIAFKKEFNPELDVEISMSFSNFYKHLEQSNWYGLLKLRHLFLVNEGEEEEESSVSILMGAESWEKFFQEMEVKGTKTLSKWREIATSSPRREREAEDDRIFRILDEAIKKDVPMGRCFDFFGYNIHEEQEQTCRWSHQCLWCEDIHELPRLCFKWYTAALKQEAKDGPDALT